MKYCKNPIVIEAVQIQNVKFEDGVFTNIPFSENPTWLDYGLENGIVSLSKSSRNGVTPIEWDILTLEDGREQQSKHTGSVGDYIIRGIKGELYFCKPDIFEATYTLVNEDSSI